MSRPGMKILWCSAVIFLLSALNGSQKSSAAETAVPVQQSQQASMEKVFNCVENLGSNCKAPQKNYYKSFVTAMYTYGLSNPPIIPPGAPSALDQLPRDKQGLVNWTKAAFDKKVFPKDYIESQPKDIDTPFNMIIFFQVKNMIISDVIFPHNVHTYWLSCNNCHPKIFKPQVGANKISMEEISKGKFCGACHGKVAFPIDAVEGEDNCRRCHSEKKNLF